jgi:hypothetical protein
MQPTVQDVILECRPEIGPDKLSFRYVVTNRSVADIYVLDLLPGYDTAAKKPIVNANEYFSCVRADGTGVFLRGIVPLPADHLVSVRIMPLGTKLPPGEKVAREFTPHWPLREYTPYVGPNRPPEDYNRGSIRSVMLAVDFIRSRVVGLQAEPAPHGPDLWKVRSPQIIIEAERLTASFNTAEMPMAVVKARYSRI